ncbi:MAG TPA: isochorismatase family cysteine hydrolase [Acidobacteriota bacterium]|nr:isochorismatase family cysteine hydrolase [Acidobacteriota bacterium]
MNKFFFLDVDTQRDFMLPGGNLYVRGAERIIPKLRRLFDFAGNNDITVISTADAHDAGDPEFEQFPAHCVRETEGQRKVAETLIPKPLIIKNEPYDRNLLEVVRRYRQIIIEKQALDMFTNPVAERLLKVLPPRAVVFGVTTEYCVKHACLGLRRRGINTVVVSDAVCAIASETEKEAIREMRSAGVDFIPLAQLLSAIAV